MSAPCTCAEHRGGAPVEIDGHRFDRASDEVKREGMFLQRWRYVCSCGGRGQWTFQSDNVPYHSWLDHLRRAKQAERRREYLRGIEEMYS